ncbi:hypothetical protein P43SY_002329 [Pythium insidiosum]|uniref:FYVE-type domain-containing protein n=1 Tax=Pythium insidiosum TaxID=114742 RepID=A0AAD5MBC1_PYTIN|nr:hypothetical protein P43SY_002329 [Pythium insidiosum]
MEAKRTDAIKLAKASRWEELRRLVDAEPLTAQQVDSYGMLPIHWACTEPHAISEAVLMALLKAYPHGARVVNTAEMVPLQIAIKAQAKIEWLQALLASYPDAVLKKTPTGENAVELARKANLPARSVRLLEEMYLHVCQKAGHSSDQLYDDDVDDGHIPPSGAASGAVHDDRPTAMRSVGSSEALHRLVTSAPNSSDGVQRGSGGASRATGSRRPSNPDAFKTRAYSDNDFHSLGTESMYRTTDASTLPRGVSTSSNGSGGGSMSIAGMPLAKPLPYQTSTKLSSRTVVSLPPRWTNAPNCHICSQKWGTFRKRHHCRNCGQSICRDHSARERMRLPHYGLPDKYRVCTVCHQMLKTAAKEMLQPSQARLTQTGLPARRSDESVARGSGGQSMGAPFNLERHVSAPARSAVEAEYQGIHHQVASLQKQVSQLMEEKEAAESQLRAQAELLNEAYGSERLTGGLGRRDRLNSVPIKLPSSGTVATVDAPQASSLSNHEALLYTHSIIAPSARSTPSIEDIRAREVSLRSDIPEPPTSGGSVASSSSATARALAAAVAPPMEESLTRLQDDMGNMSFMSSYSEFDDRSTGVYDDIDVGLPGDTLEEGDESEFVEDDDEDDEDDVGDSTLPEVEVLVNLGLSMMNKGSHSGAVQAFARAVDICPDNAVLYSYLAKAYYADENLDDAVTALERSLEMEPSAANSTLLGKILFEKGDHERAIQAYQQSLEIQQHADAAK